MSAAATHLPPEFRVVNLSAESFAAAENVSRETFLRLEAYVALLTKWQSAINLVGRDTLDDVWRRHIQDSAQLAGLIPDNAKTLTDLGSGAGFPGLVLAILRDLDVTLIESSGKKASFLREAARLTGSKATVLSQRIEAVPPVVSDVVSARALAPLDLLLGYAARFTGPDTVCLFPKGAKAEAELTEAAKSWTMAVTRHPSVTDDQGVILEIRGLVRG